MKTLKCICFLILTVQLTLFTSCSPDSKIGARDKRARNNKGDILIGAAAPWKELKEDNDLLADGIKMAVNEINESGGVLGRKIKIVWKDDHATIKEGKIAASELCKNPDVVAVIGHMNSSVAIAASVIYDHYGVVMLTPQATTPSLTTRPGTDLVFRSIATDDMFAKKLSEYAVNTGFSNKAFIDSVIIYNEDDIYGDALAKAFANLISKFGLNTVARRVYGMDANNVFFRDDLKHVETLYNFDAIFIAGLNKQAIMIINEASKIGINVQFFCSQSVEGDDLIKQTGSAANGVVYCSTYNPNTKTPKIEKFKTDFKKLYGVYPEDDAVQGYDAVYVLADAIRLAGSSAPSDIAEALHKLKYDGVAGKISFDKNGDLVDGNVVLMKINNYKEEVIGADNRTGEADSNSIPEIYSSTNIKPSSDETKYISDILNNAKKLIETKGKDGIKQIALDNKKLGDHYVIVLTKDGTNVVDPNSNQVLSNNDSVLDDAGNPIVKMIIEEATACNGGWVHYLWTPERSFYPQWKTTKCMLVKAPGGNEYVIASGCFNLKGEDQFVVDLVDDFINLFKKKGMASFVEFKNKTSRVLSSNIGIFILDDKGTILLDPSFPNLESRNMYNYKDAEGQYVFRDIINLAMKKGSVWVEYNWETAKEQRSLYKTTRVYAEKVVYGNKTYIVCGGYFLDK